MPPSAAGETHTRGACAWVPPWERLLGHLENIIFFPFSQLNIIQQKFGIPNNCFEGF